jgi:putative ABC transport system permease protein
MRVIALALREFRANWRRNAIFGAILLLAISVQLFTTLSAAASREAVATYGSAVFGYAETHSTTLEDPLTIEQLERLNTRLAEIRRSYPWFEPATAVDISAYVSVAGNPVLSGATPINLRAVSAGWRLLTPAIPDDDVWRSVTSEHRRSAALLVEADAADRLGISGPTPVTVIMDAPFDTSAPAPAGDDLAAEEQDEAEGARPDAPIAVSGRYVQRFEVLHTPVFGVYTEQNKSLVTSALVNQQVLRLGHAGPQNVQVFWRCLERCGDIAALVQTAATTVGTRSGPANRIDQIEQFRPVLEQQRREGERFALIVLLLGTLAVAIVSTAFVEVRAPQFATLRALGATRPAVGLLALLENLLTAVVVGGFAVLLGVIATRVDPNSFNQIAEVRLDSLSVPVSVYAQTALITLAVGLLTGLAPAFRAYRSVRTA